MEITKQYTKQTKQELNNNFENGEWDDITLYYEIGYVTFRGLCTVLTKDGEEIWEGNTEQLAITHNYALLYNGKQYELECFGITI